jgi:hypothetical protein
MKTDGKGGPKLILPPVMVRSSTGVFTAPSVLRLSDGTQIAISSAEPMEVQYELRNGNLFQITLGFSSVSGQADFDLKAFQTEVSDPNGGWETVETEDDLCS